MAKKSKQKSEKDKEIRKLKAQVAEQQRLIEKMSRNKTPKKRTGWRKTLAILTVSLASALLVTGNLLFWAGNTFVDTDKYVAAVGPLIEKPEIQTALASYSTQQLFNNVDVQGYVESVLPPRAAALAPQLTSQLKTHTQSTIEKILASDKVQDYWYSSLERRHDALIKVATAYEGDGTIEVSDIYNQITERLKDTRLSFLSEKQLPEKYGTIEIATVGWLPVLHKVATNIGLYQAIVTGLFLLLSAAAVYLASKKRRMVITLGVLYSILMLLTLISARIVRGFAVSKVAPEYQSAVQIAYSTVLHGLALQTYMLSMLGLFTALVAWVSGPYKGATALKKRFNLLLSGKLHDSLFKKENSVTTWAGKYKRKLQWTSLAGVSVVMLTVELSPKLVLIYSGLLIFIIALVETIAAPDKTIKK